MKIEFDHQYLIGLPIRSHHENVLTSLGDETWCTGRRVCVPRLMFSLA